MTDVTGGNPGKYRWVLYRIALENTLHVQNGVEGHEHESRVWNLDCAIVRLCDGAIVRW